jgi:nuclear pore complex protein Nup93
MNDVLNRNATKLKVGGIPSVTHRLRAFIDLIFKTSNGWNDSRLEIVDDLPIWAFIYLLIRSGNISTAAEFIDTQREMFASERKFVPYFEEYIKDPLHW